MINKESIISIFDDKPTLLKWLKKVEVALNNASAVSFNVNKRGNATLTLSIVFEDGSEIESNEFVLEQGESVQSAEVVNGVLYFTLTNGDVLNAGNILNGNITISGNLAATGNVTAGGDVEATGALKGASAVVSGSVTADSLATNGGIVAGGGIAGQGVVAAVQVSTPKLTTLGDEIAAEKPIIEQMTSYYAYPSASEAAYDLEHVYISVCKNGNKLTFVHAFNITRKDTISADFVSAIFRVPNVAMNKLFPVNVGGYEYLTLGKTFAWSGESSDKEITYHFNKETANDRLTLWLKRQGLNLLELNTKYYIRLEFTFLLSENLGA